VASNNSDAEIRIHSGTSIDLSGSTRLPVSANLLAIQLRANELADDPTQRMERCAEKDRVRRHEDRHPYNRKTALLSSAVAR